MSYSPPETESQAKAHLEAMLALLDTDGWDIFASQMRDVREYELREATEAMDSAKAMKHLGAAKAMERMLEFPHKHAAALKGQIEKGELPQT